MPQRILAACCTLALVAATASGRPYSEAFDGPVRPSIWSVRNANAPNSVATRDGRLEITAGADQLVWPWDVANTTAPMLLVAPPEPDDRYTVETRVRVTEPGDDEGWGSIAGLGVIRRDGTAAWIWGVWNGQRIALREHDIERIGEATWVEAENVENIDDARLRITRDRDGYRFLHALNGDDDWVETVERPWGSPDFPSQFRAGEYLIGLIVAAGSEEARVQFDYFDSPELGVLDVEAAGKLPVAWAGLKAR
ncbi:hypothetical protein HN371_06160 [Candidatus Poribacteria bacterium]|jgi:hypothetical protein|nr:hypothetical protein [Candidatus Poribacteria bacterium]MBT5533217.1 hypothetical protein [Candidatus Poribacteria bacterium]MBT5709532.1 hypothetical protein [Candidatus Poribacteria bacterium]MBT7096523.1 hypothetical protein [Candidatus Poribacteria bacterium]MBT7804266.1 hypothetical protein [Candidatus Poribacteria bacterium]